MNGTSHLTYDDIVERYGQWSAMAVHLGDGRYTLPDPEPDPRLRRLLQIGVDLCNKPLSEMRVLDLACLEGHYGIEFAMHGAEVLGIEAREANLVKAQFAINSLELPNASVVQDDVRNLSVDKYGRFDVILCSGILYHLPAKDVMELVQRMHDACDGILVIDTHISLAAEESVEWRGNAYFGRRYKEHDEGASSEERLRDLWASIDNTSSFWITEPSLSNLIEKVGFSSLFKCLNPGHIYPSDRVTYVAIKGARCRVLSSPVTDASAPDAYPEGLPDPSHIQRHRSWIHRAAKRLLPQALKDLIKPVLRSVGLLEKDHTPDFLKRKNS